MSDTKNYRLIDKITDTIQEGDFYMAGAFGACMPMSDRFGTKEWNVFTDYYRPTNPDGTDLYPLTPVQFVSVHPDEYQRLIQRDKQLSIIENTLKTK